MRVTLLGHATLLFEADGLTFVTDPVLHDRFADETARSLPSRTIHPDALPPLDLLYLSHRHHDHFDIQSLVMLADRVNTVICPDDPLLLKTLAEIGYENVHAVHAEQAIEVGQAELRFTPSKAPVTELGLLVTDRSGRVWNQVDTLFDLAWMPVFEGRPVDVHLANFNPITQSELLNNGSTGFPHALYNELLDVVRAVNPKLAIPSATGMVWIDDLVWTNPYTFPVAHDQFVKDIEELGLRGEVLMPGECVVVEGDRVEIDRAYRPELLTLHDRSFDAIRFEPGYYAPKLTDDAGRSIPRATLQSSVDAVFRQVEAGLAAHRLAHLEELLRRWGVRLELTVLFPDGQVQREIDFTAPIPKLGPRSGRANMFYLTTASALHFVDSGQQWDRFLAAGYRSYDTVYRITQPGLIGPPQPAQGRVPGGALPFPNDIVMGLWGISEERWIGRQIERFAKRRHPATQAG